MRQKEILVSFEGVGASGKSTQSELLRRDLSEGNRVSLVKGVDRNRMVDSLWAFREREHEKFWVTNLPKVTPGVEMLTLAALMKQQYHDLVNGGGKDVIIFDRYVDTAFTLAAAKVTMDGLLDREKRIDALYQTFIGLRHIVRWPDATILVDTPLEVASQRGEKRENRPYTEDDLRGFRIVAELYARLANREPERFHIVDGTKSIEELRIEIRKIIAPKLVPVLRLESDEFG